MAVRKRVWLNSPNHNYTDRKRVLINEQNYEQFVIYEEENTHWNHGNFVDSVCVSIAPVAVLNKLPNYLLIFNGSEIESRYFVFDYSFISGEPKGDKSKYNVTLKRDVIVDFRTAVKNNPHRVRRGSLPSNTYSPVLVQPEGLLLNEVKTHQTPIKSWDGDANWLTIFYDGSVEASSRTISFDWASGFTSDFTLEQYQSSFSSGGFINVSETSTSNIRELKNVCYKKNLKEVQFRLNLPPERSFYFDITIRRRGDVNTITPQNFPSSPSETDAKYVAAVGELFRNDVCYLNSNGRVTQINRSGTAGGTSTDVMLSSDRSSQYANFRNTYDNRIIVDTDSVQSRASFSEDNSRVDTNNLSTNYIKALNSIFGGTYDILISSASYPPGWQWLQSIFGETFFMNTFGAGSFTVNPSLGTNVSRWDVHTFSAYLSSLLSNGQLILPNTIKMDELNLYCVSIPFGTDVTITTSDGTYSIDRSSILSIGTEGFTSVGTVVKDIQVLPYCPVGSLNALRAGQTPSNAISTAGLGSGNIVYMTDSAGTKLYPALICSIASMDYRFDTDISAYLNPNLKISSIINKTRLCAHNHKSSFPFTPALNNGWTQTSFSYTLRPFNTVFRICPVFNQGTLYGGNFKDARGLIWEGGFSLAQITDQWVEYKLQNSTYESMFNREIENLELTQLAARNLETLNMQTSYQNAQTSLQASAAKGLLNAAVGGIGAVATKNPLGLVSAGAGLLGNRIDVTAGQQIVDRNLSQAMQAQSVNDSLRSEAIAYAKDNFNFTNQAIQSRTTNLASNTDYSILNETKAYIEIYSCSNAELQYVTQYLDYNGMKIDQTGIITDYINSTTGYVESSMIFCEGLTPVIANAINADLIGGVYIQGGLLDA